METLKADNLWKGKEKKEKKEHCKWMFTVHGIRSINRLAQKKKRKQAKKYAIIILDKIQR